jgi:uncharacterized membrane protein
VPFVVSSLIISIDNSKKLTKTILFILSFVWLLLIPNAPYIVTDLIHIGEVRSVPILYDALLLFTSALAGLELGFVSIDHINSVLLKKYGKNKSTTLIIFFILFMSFGIYLGRFLRFNSWDIFARPFSFLKAIGEIFTHGNLLLQASFYTVVFFIFILFLYISWKYKQEK